MVFFGVVELTTINEEHFITSRRHIYAQIFYIDDENCQKRVEEEKYTEAIMSTTTLPRRKWNRFEDTRTSTKRGLRQSRKTFVNETSLV